MKNTHFLPLALVVFALLLPGCIYEAPITEKPTRKIDSDLLGDWVESDNDTKHLTVYKLNDSEYIVEYDKIIYHAYHSELEGLHFLSAKNISATTDDERRWAFMTYGLKDNGKKLEIHTVNTKVVPETLHTTAEIQAAIKKNIKSPQLLNEEAGTFVRPK